MNEVMDLDDAAAFVRLSKKLLARAARRGGLRCALIPSSTGGGGYRFTRSALIEWVDAGCPGSSGTADNVDEKDGEE